MVDDVAIAAATVPSISERPASQVQATLAGIVENLQLSGYEEAATAGMLARLHLVERPLGDSEGSSLPENRLQARLRLGGSSATGSISSGGRLVPSQPPRSGTLGELIAKQPLGGSVGLRGSSTEVDTLGDSSENGEAAVPEEPRSPPCARLL